MIDFYKSRCNKWAAFNDIELLHIFHRLTKELGMLWDVRQSHDRRQIESLIDWMAVEKGKRVMARRVRI